MNQESTIRENSRIVPTLIVGRERKGGRSRGRKW